MKIKEIKSGDHVKCKCGYIGYVYGIPTGNGITAPWCPKCQMNNKLTKEPEVNI